MQFHIKVYIYLVAASSSRVSTWWSFSDR